MAPRIPVPLYIECANPACGAMKRVRNRHVQRVQRFCSKRCGYLIRVKTNFTREANARGGRMRASRARAALIARVAHLSPVEAFRIGYVRGLQSKWRKTAQRLRGAA